MLAPALYYSPAAQRRQHSEHFLSDDADASGTLVAASCNQQHFFCASDLPPPKPCFCSGTSFDGRRQQLTQVQRSLSAERNLIECVPQSIELRFAPRRPAIFHFAEAMPAKISRGFVPGSLVLSPDHRAVQ